MNWKYLKSISSEIEITICNPFINLLDNIGLFADCSIQVTDGVNVRFSRGLAASYSGMLRQNINKLREIEQAGEHENVVADLSQIVEKYNISVDILKTSLDLIFKLFLLGKINRIHKVEDTSSKEYKTLNIPKECVFPIIFILNVLKADYHLSSFLEFSISQVYIRKISKPNRNFRGYDKRDKTNIIFYVTLILTFEKYRPDIIYSYLHNNRNDMRFLDLLSLVRDYIGYDYIEKNIEVIHRVSTVLNDDYIIHEGEKGGHMKLTDRFSIVDHREVNINTGSNILSNNNMDSILFTDTKSYDMHLKNLPRTITHQMIQDRLPLDINRKKKFRIEGWLSSILYPFLFDIFEKESERSDCERSEEESEYVNMRFDIFVLNDDIIYKIHVKFILDGFCIISILPLVGISKINKEEHLTDNHRYAVWKDIRDNEDDNMDYEQYFNRNISSPILIRDHTG